MCLKCTFDMCNGENTFYHKNSQISGKSSTFLYLFVPLNHILAYISITLPQKFNLTTIPYPTQSSTDNSSSFSAISFVIYCLICNVQGCVRLVQYKSVIILKAPQKFRWKLDKMLSGVLYIITWVYILHLIYTRPVIDLPGFLRCKTKINRQFLTPLHGNIKYITCCIYMQIILIRSCFCL